MEINRLPDDGTDPVSLEMAAALHEFDDNDNFYDHVAYHELDTNITYDEVYTAIKSMKCGKSPGYDMLLNELFIFGKDVLTTSITRIFNHILNVGYFPQCWSEGVIVPLHKNVNNYRGITLLSVFSKLFTRVINTRLSTWAEHYGIMYEGQAGFRKMYGTRYNLFTLNGIVSHVLNKKEKLYCAFIDFKRAFDTIFHDCGTN